MGECKSSHRPSGNRRESHPHLFSWPNPENTKLILCVTPHPSFAVRHSTTAFPQKIRYNGSYQIHETRFLETSQVKQVVTESDIPASGELKVPLGTIVTPSARDLAVSRGVLITALPADRISSSAPPDKTVALGADHGGFLMKELLKPIFAELSLAVRDVGVHDEKPVDYPDIALQVAELVAAGTARRGVVIDGAGIGSAMAANKVPGVRAALCYDKSSAKNSREHNDSNVLTLGGKLLTRSQAEDVLRVWLSTPFGGGRHQARIDKIIQIERKYSK